MEAIIIELVKLIMEINPLLFYLLHLVLLNSSSQIMTTVSRILFGDGKCELADYTT